MKRLSFLFLAIFATAKIYSQTYTISFAAIAAASTVDSVKVENLTHTATVKWDFGDVLQLILSNGINELGENDENLQVFPNPMQGQTEISFYAKQAGNTTISIYDIAGKVILQSKGKLIYGTHKYQLTGLKEGVYFINIRGEGYFYTVKLISQNATTLETKIKYIGNEKQEVVSSNLKSTKSTVTMNYTTGDNIRFTGYAGSLTAIVNDVPTGSKTITFTFIASLPTVTTTAASVITSTTATTGGNVTADGGAAVTARGVCYATTTNPTTANSTVANGNGNGMFTANITGLAAITAYYARAYATNSVGTAYGNQISFTTNLIPTSLIPAGTFTMGSPITEVSRGSDEEEYQVTLSAFLMSKFQITNTQYAAFLNAKSIGSNGIYSAGAYSSETLIYSSSGLYDWGLHYTGSQWIPVAGYENHPVINVTWYGASEFAIYAGGTLPTEAQWEYACRGNTTTPFYTGACLSNTQANYKWQYPYNTCTNTITTYPATTQAVGTYPANIYGLHDMHGNVWEWCSDWYG
ncbi:MAG: SUMF1/EgtB/PvdO family nonheme iron enzyme, partial [Bacteroidales bacterium]